MLYIWIHVIDFIVTVLTEHQSFSVLFSQHQLSWLEILAFKGLDSWQIGNELRLGLILR